MTPLHSTPPQPTLLYHTLPYPNKKAKERNDIMRKRNGKNTKYNK